MELNNPAPVIRLADIMLSEPLPFDNDDDNAPSQRRRAIVRIYACEAMSLMGNPEGGMHYLPPDDIDSMVGFLANNESDGNQQLGTPDEVKASIEMSIAAAKILAGKLNTAKESA